MGAFEIIPFIVIMGFIVVFGMFIYRFVTGAIQWQKNNASPVLTVDAKVVTKREDVNHYHHNTGVNGMHHSGSTTVYFATFEFASGDRLELRVSGTEFGMLAEGDAGSLTFQGTRYLGFERKTRQEPTL